MTEYGSRSTKIRLRIKNAAPVFFALCALASAFCFISPVSADEYALDISETEKKPYRFGGYAELRPVLYGLDREAALYKLNFYNRHAGAATYEYNGELRLEGSYEYDMSRLSLRMNTDYKNSYLGETRQTVIQEGFLSLKPSSSLKIDAGKKTLNWGKGYAWNPAAFLDRPKDPNDPELSREGYIVASADYIRSFNGPLKTLSVTPVLIPVSGRMNDDFGTTNHLNTAGKVYLLLYDTDIDFLFLTGGSRPSRMGMDFSRNITTNLEVHGEYARIDGFTRSYIAADGTTHQTVYDATSWLLGLRYLTEKDATYLLEYYRNGTGFTGQETRDYFTFAHNAYESYLSSGNDTLLQKAAAVTEKNYGRPNAGREYLYLRASQKDPFDVLYWTPAVTAIVNAEDGSYSLSPEIVYTGITNLELRLKAMVLAGRRLSEFGEKLNDYRAELRARYYF
jgi:hypothetical protein